ncbi:hypothetical protein F7725_020211 [Dissostichus mawsoni]|uniref:Ig-like domain-containing protein n=1 Tax=Dissostichus mawsoni TaxID=36200 RepID=A0A7J5YDH9_DISMA|nr:hypothetical protein F7725_020211 [Dissostichus mawsoni]
MPCQFTDEHVFKNVEGHTETQLIHREALLQFGQIGDAAVNPHGITFLITVSKLDLRRYLEGVEAEQLECELRRYSTAGIHVRWPVLGAREYNHWFTFTLKHTNGLFRITGFLRHPSDTAAPGQQDYNSWTPIGDREMLVTTTAMVMKTLTPSVRAGLGSKQKLHCQFAVDHHGPNFHVEWLLQQRGERTSLFSHSSRSVQSKGSGVVHRSLADGDASYTLPFTKFSSEGTYICSVSVLPLFVSMDIVLQIEEAPRVSLNVGPTLTLLEGGEQRVTCEATVTTLGCGDRVDPVVAGQRVGAPLPEKLQNVLLSSHKQQRQEVLADAFFYLRLHSSTREGSSHAQYPITRRRSRQVSWLPCQFTDEHVFKNVEGHGDSAHPQKGLLQFGQIGDAAVNPHGITFLITGSGAEQLECELRRYSTAGIHVRWPVLGARKYNHWFTCTLRHTNGLFRITGFLRHPSDKAAPGQQDYNSWTPIGDREMLVTTTAMVMKTLTPSVRAGLGSKQKLHCQFAVDHHGPNFMWSGSCSSVEREPASSVTAAAQYRARGPGSYIGAWQTGTLPIPFPSPSSAVKGRTSVQCPCFHCSSVWILFCKSKAPRVSLNVGPTLTLLEGGEQRVTCEANSYYPLDVEIGWYMQDPVVAGQRVGAPLPEKLPNVLLSSHKQNNDKKYSLTAFFYLRAALKHSGREFTCTVSHKSLRVPIKKSFTLTVEGEWRRAGIIRLLGLFVMMILASIKC